jgi:cytidylate kinase
VKTNVIAISRAMGANGEVIGREIAAGLGYRYLDSEIIDLAAERVGATAEEVASAERRKGLLARMLDNLARANFASPDMPVDPSLFTQQLGPEYPQIIVGVIREVAAQGKCVLVAHGASHALGASEGVLRVLVTGSPDVRAARIHKDSHGPGRARQEIDESDKARADFLKRFYDIDEESSDQYDLVLNTDRITVADAVKAVRAVAG